jgi:hypothetical protein
MSSLELIGYSPIPRFAIGWMTSRRWSSTSCKSSHSRWARSKLSGILDRCRPAVTKI